MAISDRDHLEFMQNTSRSLGEIKAAQASTLDFLKAVNENQKRTANDLREHERVAAKALGDHAVDETAHGGRARRGVWSDIGAVLALIIAVAGLFVALK